MNAAAGMASGGRLGGMLESPFVGMSPWIIFSVLVGPGRYEFAVGVALGLAVLIFVLGRVVHRGSAVKLLEITDIVFFALLAGIGIAASPDTLHWLETYAGELSNLALVVIAFGSLAVGMPFTMQYARESVGREHWNSPQFLRANQVITGAWGLAFLIAAIAGGFGDLVLHNPNNLWTGWIIQIAAIVAAMSFTEWYPRVVRSRHSTGVSSPPVRHLLTPLAGLLIPVGVVVLIFDAAAAWFGVGLILVGVVLARAINKDKGMTGPRGAHSRRK